jgi:hypothetical protein
MRRLREVWARLGVLQETKSLPVPAGLEKFVARPAETDRVVAALLERNAGARGITVGLVGAAGTGKTTIAAMACLDPRVQRRFSKRIYWIAFGPDTGGAAEIASKVNDIIKLIFGQDATFTDPQLAGQQLGALLDAGPRRLLVLDDVWDERQLAPFANGSRSCARLVTTRRAGLLVGHGVTVRVDQMHADQARQTLIDRLPPLNPTIVDELVEVCGRWPLLLGVVNANLVSATQRGTDVSVAATEVLERLREPGPAGIDELSEKGRGPDVRQATLRTRTVAAAITASISLLDQLDADRFAELGVFAEDETIPFTLVSQLWQATGGLDEPQAAQLCARLNELSLVSFVYSPEPWSRGLTLHDVVRDFLRTELGPQRLADLNGLLLDTVASHLPISAALDSGPDGSPRVAWWELGHSEWYLWDHLVEHMHGAGRTVEAEELANDPRWKGSQVLRLGPAPIGDRFASYNLSEEFERVMASREFTPYEDHISAIKTRFEAEIGAFLGVLSVKADDLGAAILDAADARPWIQVRGAASRHRLLTSSLAALVVALLLVAYIAYGGPFPGMTAGGLHRFDRYWFIGFLSVAALVAGLSQFTAWWIRLRQTHASRQADVERARSAYEQERARLVAEAVRRSVTDMFRAATVIDFPLLAPTLVELSTAKIVPSGTQDEVRDFVANHDSSAIGLAGPRGSGKSTLMQAVAEAKGLATHTVRLTAPVKYDTLEFTRRLFREVATEIVLRAGYQPDAAQRMRRQRIAAARFRRDILVLVIFFFLASVAFLWSLTHETWHWSWATGAGFVVVGILVLIGATPLVSLAARFFATFRPSSTVRDGGDPLSVRMARDALETLVWDVEQEQKEGSKVSLFTGVLEFEGEDSLKLARRESSLPELVADFRSLLTQFSAEGSVGYEKRFVIFVDELDKIANTDGLIEAINGIKDLMHIPGVHFVVSVSEDALLRFEERGIPARDAFDSTFDTIIRMRRLTLRESLDILTARAAAFPEAISLACHAWSGGLPRDLLRIARRCVTIQRNSTDNLHVADIVRMFVIEDLQGHVANAMRTEGLNSQTISTLMTLSDIVDQVGQGAGPAKSLTKIPEPRINTPLSCTVEIGLLLLALFADSNNGEFVESQIVRERFEALATAMAVRTGPDLLRARLVSDLAKDIIHE